MTTKRENYPKHKIQTIEDYNKSFTSTSAAFLIKYKGTSVEKLTDLRKKLHANGSKLKIIKNRLAKIAVVKTPVETLSADLTSDNAIVLSGDDVAQTAKTLSKIAKEIETIILVRGVLYSNSDKTMNADDIIKLGNLPSREVLLTQLACALNGPLTKLVRTLNEPIASLARVLSIVAKNKNN